MNSTTRNLLDELNESAPQEALASLLPLCASPRWASALVERGPYADLDALLDTSDSVFAELETADLDAALAEHPRIGDRVGGDHQSAALSRNEQSAMQSADAQVADQILRGNEAYEQRFDRVFLIRAAGRAPGEILGELQRRLQNDDADELVEVREQLRQITRLRLEGAFGR